MEYDPLSADTLDNPYPLYARLRRSSPVFWHERLNSWVLTRYADCLTVIRDPTRFASDLRRAGYQMARMDHPSLQVLDPPEHTSVRRLFMTAFHGQNLREIEERATDESVATFSQMADRPSFDVVADVAQPVTLFAVSRLLGVDPPELSDFAALTDAVERGMDGRIVPEAVAPAVDARRRLDELVRSWATTSRQGLLADALRAAKAAGLPEEAVWSSARVLFLAGFSTTVSAAVNMVLALVRRPEAFRLLRDRELADTGIDELIRYDSPIQWASRTAVEPAVINDVRVERGQQLLLLLGAANRDPEQFVSPDDLVLDRRPNRHLAFGWGPHVCLGALLARVVLKALITGMHRVSATPRVVGPVCRRPRATVRYPNRLTISFQSS